MAASTLLSSAHAVGSNGSEQAPQFPSHVAVAPRVLACRCLLLSRRSVRRRTMERMHDEA